MTTHAIPHTAPASAPNCWTTFSNGVSSVVRKLADGVMKLWTMIKNGARYVYHSLTPYVARAVHWAKVNPQMAAVGGGVALLATAAGTYFCFCRKTADVDVVAKKTTTVEETVTEKETVTGS